MSVDCEWDADLGVVVIANASASPLRAHVCFPRDSAEAHPHLEQVTAEQNLDRFAGEVPAGDLLAIRANFRKFEIQLFDAADPLFVGALPRHIHRFDAALRLDDDARPNDGSIIEQRVFWTDPATGAITGGLERDATSAEPPIRRARSRRRRSSGGVCGPSTLARSTASALVRVRFGLDHEELPAPFGPDRTRISAHPAAEVEVDSDSIDLDRFLKAIAVFQIETPTQLAAAGPGEIIHFRSDEPTSSPLAPQSLSRGETIRISIAWSEAAVGDVIGIAARGDLRLELAPVEESDATARDEFDAPLQLIQAAPLTTATGASFLVGVFLGDALLGAPATAANDFGRADSCRALRAAQENLIPYSAESADRFERLGWLPARLIERLDDAAERASPSVLRAYFRAREIAPPGLDIARLESFAMRPEAAWALAGLPSLAARAEPGSPRAGVPIAHWLAGLAIGDATRESWLARLGAEGEALVYRLAVSGRNDILRQLAHDNALIDAWQSDDDKAIADWRRARDTGERRAADIALRDIAVSDGGRGGELAELQRYDPLRDRRASAAFRAAQIIARAQQAVDADLGATNAALAAIGQLSLDARLDALWRDIGRTNGAQSLDRLRAAVLSDVEQPALRAVIDGVRTRAVLLRIQRSRHEERRISADVERVFSWAERVLALDDRIGWEQEPGRSPPINRAIVEETLVGMARAVEREQAGAPAPRLRAEDPLEPMQRDLENEIRRAAGEAERWFTNAIYQHGGEQAESWPRVRRTARLIQDIGRLAPWIALRAAWRLSVDTLARIESEDQRASVTRAAARLRRRLTHPPAQWPEISARIGQLARRVRLAPRHAEARRRG